MTIKIVAVVIFIAIIASLGSALFHLVKSSDPEQSRKTAKALTYRIGLSLLLFILLFVAFATGLFKPEGIGSRIQQAHSAKGEQASPNPR
ncbi:twin transmembrane helix small protein [Methylomonas sp. LL1]|uniref:twin transmembrane helix small protein n=1 Tax=Methylomonas sp. LL1 TaxID=2785785 RepID=UPI0018C42A80|nr:twin transmembrane helix small protein [Methylomonas sp. LL1]QPK65330.1 twin transmembrane helix small protein [Methylomonas sp. LL1]